jgi:hypothetical protein
MSRITLRMWASDDADVLEYSVRYHRAMGVDRLELELRNATRDTRQVARAMELAGLIDAIVESDGAAELPFESTGHPGVTLRSGASEFWMPRVGTLAQALAQEASYQRPLRSWRFLPASRSARGFGLASVMREVSPTAPSASYGVAAGNLPVPPAHELPPGGVHVFSFPHPQDAPELPCLTDGDRYSAGVMEGTLIMDRRLETQLRRTQSLPGLHGAASAPQRRMALALVDELVAVPELLTAWGIAFSAHDTITLTVLNRAMDQQQAVSELQRVGAELGLDGDGSPNIVLHPDPLGMDVIRDLGLEADLIYTSQPMIWPGYEAVPHVNAQALPAVAEQLRLGVDMSTAPTATHAPPQPEGRGVASSTQQSAALNAGLPTPSPDIRTRGNLIDPTRVVVSTVFEAREPWSAETVMLFTSLRVRGGDLADARGRAYCVGTPTPEVVRELAALDVEVLEVTPFDQRCPHANKLHMLVADGDTDWVVMLDTDIAFAGDIAPQLVGSSVLAKPVDRDPLGWDGWVQLFTHAGVAIPAARYLTHFEHRETIPYFNSGVVMVPVQHVEVLREAWERRVRWVLDALDQMPLVAPHRFFTDQFAFALALAETGLPHRALPLECNFPTHEPVHEAWMPDDVVPLLFHHHHRLDASGVMLPSSHRRPNAVMHALHQELGAVVTPAPMADLEPVTAFESDRISVPSGGTSPASTTALATASVHAGVASAPAASAPAGSDSLFDNEQFWDHRYATDMTLGSGHGSRGQVAEYKRAVMQELIDRTGAMSLLDVGCGDIEIVRGLRFDGEYTGIDISGVVVERNRLIKPDWTFLHGDFTQLGAGTELAADVTVCCDVLIHQHDVVAYRAMVEGLVRNTRTLGMIAAYDAPPSGDMASSITAYHEPITATLRAAGATNVNVVGEYRSTAVVIFGPPAG